MSLGLVEPGHLNTQTQMQKHAPLPGCVWHTLTAHRREARGSCWCLKSVLLSLSDNAQTTGTDAQPHDHSRTETCTGELLISHEWLTDRYQTKLL